MNNDSIILFLVSVILSYLLVNGLFELEVPNIWTYTILTFWFAGILMINIGIYLSNKKDAVVSGDEQ